MKLPSFFRRKKAPEAAEPAVAGAWALAPFVLASEKVKLAELNLRMGNLLEADKLYTEVRPLLPDHAIKGLAEVARRQGDYDKAKHLWQEFIVAYPDARVGPFSLAGIFLQMGQPQQAMDLCIAEADAHPGEGLYLMQMVNIVMSGPEMRQKYLSMVQERITAYWQNNPFNPGLLHSWGHLCLDTGNLESAHAAYAWLWDKDPFNKSVREKMDRVADLIAEKTGKRPVMSDDSKRR